MHLLRSSGLQKQLDILQTWMTDVSEAPSLFSYHTEMHIAPSIWEDITIEEWFQTMSCTPTEAEFGKAVLHHPSTNISLLQTRQEGLSFFHEKTKLWLTSEEDQTLQWFLTVSHLDKNYLYKVLFPTSWYMKWLYVHPHFFTLYHIYRCYLSPLTTSIYPLSVFIAPYWFLRKTMKWKLSPLQYLQMMQKVYSFVKQTSHSSTEWYRFVVVLFVYLGIYLYSTAQVIDVSYQLHRFKQQLLHKIKVLSQLQQKVQRILVQYGNYEFWKPYEPEITREDLHFSYRPVGLTLFKCITKSSFREKIQKLYKVCIIHDFLLKLSKLRFQGWCYPKYGAETWIGSMRNPMLPYTQVPNPIRLDKHLMISGPNAGGKTTYVKSLLWNTLLAQSFGIVYGTYGQIKLYDAILHHHRVRDTTGEQSLFQAEMNKIKEMLDTLPTYQQVLYFLDEPMHSTHPLDGEAMLAALLYFVAKKKNLRVVLTSHYFLIQKIEKALPSLFRNLHVRALCSKEEIQFDFQMYSGGSQQTIGIELLEKEGFPADMLETATKIKNKLYSQKVNV